MIQREKLALTELRHDIYEWCKSTESLRSYRGQGWEDDEDLNALMDAHVLLLRALALAGEQVTH